jgi:hypothetical protein
MYFQMQCFPNSRSVNYRSKFRFYFKVRVIYLRIRHLIWVENSSYFHLEISFLFNQEFLKLFVVRQKHPRTKCSVIQKNLGNSVLR